jgi:hypothetical protein
MLAAIKAKRRSHHVTMMGAAQAILVAAPANVTGKGCVTGNVTGLAKARKNTTASGSQANPTLDRRATPPRKHGRGGALTLGSRMEIGEALAATRSDCVSKNVTEGVKARNYGVVKGI